MILILILNGKISIISNKGMYLIVSLRLKMFKIYLISTWASPLEDIWLLINKFSEVDSAYFNKIRSLRGRQHR